MKIILRRAQYSDMLQKSRLMRFGIRILLKGSKTMASKQSFLKSLTLHPFLSAIGAALILLSFASTARATSGPGCLRVVHVASWDSLKMRARPSHRSRVVDRLRPNRHGILHLDKACTPRWRKWSKRWCKVTHYSGRRTRSGWVKARFIRDNDCP